jgi:tetratricopeptide (TPR) repeat protein
MLDCRAWCDMADAAVRLERWEDAANAFRQAATLDPADPSIIRNLGAALSNMGRFKEALAAFKTAVTLEPANVQFRLTYARLLIEQGQHSEAMVEIEEGSRLALARALADHEQTTASRAGESEPAISISPDHVAAVRELGGLLDRSNQIEGLRKLLAAADKSGIAAEELAYLAASVALRESRPQEARRLLLHDRRNIDDVRWCRLMTRIEDAIRRTHLLLPNR